MKKLKLLIVTAFATLFVAFGVSPVIAFAEESVETPEISVEIETSEEVINSEETVEFTPVSYRYVEDETHYIMVDLIDEENAVLRARERSGDASWEVARLNATYMLSTEYKQLWIWAEDDFFAVFLIQEDNTLADMKAEKLT